MPRWGYGRELHPGNLQVKLVKRISPFSDQSSCSNRAGEGYNIDKKRQRMMYFWFVPVLVLLLVLLWMLFAAATKKHPGRTDGRTVLDKESANKNEPH